MGKLIDKSEFWLIKDNPITKTGVFPYLGAQIGQQGLDADKIYYVLRPAEELFKPETVESFNGIPITIEHAMLGSEDKGLTKPEDKGIDGVTLESAHQNGDKLLNNIRLFSEQIKDAVNSGKKELSAGYYCDFVPESGEYQGQHYDFVQRNIFGNHIALVDKGRSGSEIRVMDSAIKSRMVFDSMDLGTFTQDWEENKHPRDDDGKFTNKGSGSASSGKSEQGKTETAKSDNAQSKEFGKRKADLKNNSKTVETQTAGDIFTPSAELVKRFKNDIQDILLDEEAHNYKKIDMGVIPQLYVELGLPKQNLKISKLSLRKALGMLTEEELEENTDWHNHNVPRSVIDNLPVLISNPLAVFKSLSTSTNPNGFVSVLDETNEDGKQIVAIINPSKKNNGFTFIPSVYERDDFDYFVRQTNAEGKILYVDKERASLPETLMKAATVGNKALINNIQTKDKIVNTKSKQNREDKPMETKTQDAWEENKHPRDNDGKFSSGNGGKNSNTKMTAKMHKNEYADFVKNAKKVGNKIISHTGSGLMEIHSITQNNNGTNHIEYTPLDDSDENWDKYENGNDNAKLYLITKTNGASGQDTAPEQEEAKMDKREVVREIMAIAAKPETDFKGGEEERIDTIAKLAEKIAYNPSEAGANDKCAADKEEDKENVAETVKEEVKPEAEKANEEKEKEEKIAAAMDAMEKRILANMEAKNSLIAQLTPVIGAFDSAKMTVSEIAKYACDKLKLTCATDEALPTLKGFLAGKRQEVIVKPAAAMDSANTEDEAFKAYMEGK